MVHGPNRASAGRNDSLTPGEHGSPPGIVFARRLVDYAAIADGWHVIRVAIGPAGDLTLLLSEKPLPWQLSAFIREEPFVGLDNPSRYRAIHLLPDHFAINSMLDIPATDVLMASAQRQPDGDWLVMNWGRLGANATNDADIYRDDGTLAGSYNLRRMGVGQMTTDGRLWGGYGDELIFSGDEVSEGGIVCFDAKGGVAFRFHHDVAENGQAPSVWAAAGLNVVSDDEVWISYFADDPPEPGAAYDEYYALVKLSGYRVERVWPWRIVLQQAPASPPGDFAVAEDRLLLQGSGYGLGQRDPTANHPHARLYDVSLQSNHRAELLPVDERGTWIGPFRSEGRGSKLYLATNHALHMVDAAVDLD